MKTKVAILGAGCSCSYGYPLAAQMKDHLLDFAKSIKTSAPKLHKLARETLDIFETLAEQGCPVQTLDQLAWSVHQGKMPGMPTISKAYPLVERAKTVVSGMFLAKENEMAGNQLSGYQNFLSAIFRESSRCDRALEQSPWRVLSFNYDRLFEIAFRRRFTVDPTKAFYGESLLNSGLYPLDPENVKINTERFALLKLHGSIGFSSVDDYGRCNHYHSIPDPLQPNPITDETFFPDNGHGLKSDGTRPSLIIFSHEKNHLEEYPRNRLSHRVYIPEIWKAARVFVSQADEIHVIGYSVSDPDWKALGSLLQSAQMCERIIVKNPYPWKACQNLKQLLPNFAGKIMSIEVAFE